VLVSGIGWPDVRSMRCLDLGRPSWGFAAELRRQGAAEVVERHGAGPGDLDPDVLGEFDLVAAGDVLTGLGLDEAGALLDAVAAVGAGVLVSVEPIDPVASVVHRGRARTSAAGTMNGWAHRTLLRRVARREEHVSAPFVVPGEPPASLVARAVGAALARDPRPGVLHRALVVRLRLPGGDPLRPPAGDVELEAIGVGKRNL
jgi:hypothetical protein